MTENNNYAIETRGLNIFYDDFQAVKDINLQIDPKRITAIIGPSGCGKSTVLRAFNRMNDFVPSAHATGEVIFHEQNVYDPEVDAVQNRGGKRLGSHALL